MGKIIRKKIEYAGGGGGALPPGGTTGQALVKNSDTSGDAGWKTIGGGAIIDTAMSDTSENPVQNKVIKQYVDNIATPINDADIDTITQ